MTAGDWKVVGKPSAKVDSLDKCTGRTRYAGDLKLPGMAFGKLLRSTRPHARIAGIDLSRAENLPGVLAVITGKDLPIRYGILPVSQDETALAVDKVRYAGEPVAAIAAVDAETAEAALDLIEVRYEPLSPVMSIEEAFRDGSPRIHEDGDGPNIHKRVSLEFGDVDRGLAEADHVREDTFFYDGSNHVAIEEHAVLASYEGTGKLTVWSSTQVPHYLHRVLQKVLEFPANRVRVISPPVGGGYGGKSDVFSHEIVAAKLSIQSGRPVRITCTREEVFYLHRGRHPVLMKVKTGFTRDGRITAMSFRSILDGGAYGGYGVASTYYTGALQTITYRIPAYRFEGIRVFTNKPPCGPKRGHGTPQPRFAVECHLDKAAQDLGMDPVALRVRNLVRPFSTTVNHLRITSCGLQECIEKVLRASRFHEERGRLPPGRGMGFAVSGYISGAALPIYWDEKVHSEVRIEIGPGGAVTVYSMASDIGQGSTSMLALVVAEVLGLDPMEIGVVTADTELTPVDLGSYSSRVTFMAGNAAIEAATKARQRILEEVAHHWMVPVTRLVAKDHRIYNTDRLDEGTPWVDAVNLALGASGPLVVSGSYSPPNLAGPYKGSGVGPSPAYSYSACVAEVTCDPDTGHVAVNRIWLAHDVGRALNPRAVESQIEGSVCMGLGETLFEQHAFRGELLKSPSILDHKVPTILEMPEIHTIIVESIDPEGPFGAKEVGQGPLLPVAPAIANAIHDALGVRIDEIPITPEKVLLALKEKMRHGASARAGPSRFPDAVFTKPALRVSPPREPEPTATGG